MAENTKIEWAHHTFNPWIGCTKVGPGCDNCYAEADFDKRRHVAQWGTGQPRKRTAPSNWAQPLRWNAKAGINLHAWEQFKSVNGVSDEHLVAKGLIKPTRPRVFCASLADVFDNEVPVEWRMDLFSLIEQTPNLDWLLLTKRIGNVGNMLPVPFDFERHYPNVWIGATITSQAEADRDIPKLLAVDAAKRFLSMEPLLGPVDLMLDSLVCNPCLRCADQSADPDTGAVEHCRHCEWTGKGDEWGIDWVIVGGESGPNARPMHPDWARSLRDQCQSAGVPFFLKQWGEWVDIDNGPDADSAYEGKSDCWAHIEGGHDSGEAGVDFFNTHPMYQVGKKAAGRLLDGIEWNEVPAC